MLDTPATPAPTAGASSGPVERAAPSPFAGGCCPAGGAVDAAGSLGEASERWAKPVDGSPELRRIDFLTPDVNCGACIACIEGAMSETPGVRAARVNLSLKRVSVVFSPADTTVDALGSRLAEAGYAAKPFDAAALDAFRSDAVGRELLASLAVAGFAAANVMLLSVSVWSGAEAATRDLMHWISALIALPAVAFAGRPFFRSAMQALSKRRLNMDVPISLAVILAAAVSLYETVHSGHHAYFDAAVSLLFFLLIGRFLDHRSRGLARSAAAELTALSATAATVIAPDGTRREAPIDMVAPGDVVEVAAGARAPADGRVIEGRSDIDRSMVTGETRPETVGVGDMVHAGMTNLTGPLRLRVSATEDGTLLAEIARMIEEAERGANRYTRLADRAAKLYAPLIHLAGLAAFLGWMLHTGGDWRTSILVASALLIITCPCALALAVPAVQATAGGVLFRSGVFVKDGAALEKLAEVDVAVFDKTGTVTLGRPELVDAPPPEDAVWPAALALAEPSRHPLSKALAAAARGAGVRAAPLEEIEEVPGCGVEALWSGRRARLGRADWCGVTAEQEGPDDGRSRVWIAVAGEAPRAFAFEDAPRADAAEAIAALQAAGVETRLLSGDRPAAVAKTAARVGIKTFHAQQTPAEKLAHLEALRAEGRNVLMVGDGINDAPALAAAHVSISPADASDVTRAAAGFVFTGEGLGAVAFAHRTAKAARARAIENFGLAAVYNAIAIPIAAAGLVTPLVAALAMSSSSIVVTLNAVRLRLLRPEGADRATPQKRLPAAVDTSGRRNFRPTGGAALESGMESLERSS